MRSLEKKESYNRREIALKKNISKRKKFKRIKKEKK